MEKKIIDRHLRTIRKEGKQPIRHIVTTYSNGKKEYEKIQNDARSRQVMEVSRRAMREYGEGKTIQQIRDSEMPGGGRREIRGRGVNFTDLMESDSRRRSKKSSSLFGGFKPVRFP